MQQTIVRDLRESDSTRHYSLPPREAVIAAYAQAECNDHNTWQYEQRYGHLVVEGYQTIACGDWCAFKDGR